MRYICFKVNCRFKKWTPALGYILNVLNLIQNKAPWIPDLVVTSVNDGKHMQNSKHYTDEAVDLRTRDFKSSDDKEHFIKLLREYLGPKFTVLHESVGTANEHIHVQVKKGTVYL